MSIFVEDRCGLNGTEVLDMPLLFDQKSKTDNAEYFFKKIQPQGKKISLAGMRHSQGGQTSLKDAYLALTETYNQIVVVDPIKKTITVQGGATWSQVHHALNPYGLAPLVHQSSPQFTVGGSISVNCHGRDHLHGALANTIVSLKVLTGTGVVLDASTKKNTDLFKAVIGGYGSCGMILEATLRVTTNDLLQMSALSFGDFEMKLSAYAKYLKHLYKKDEPILHMHIAWLKFTDGDFFEKVAGYDYKLVNASGVSCNYVLTHEEFGHTEVMRAAWHSAKESNEIRKINWDVLKSQHESNDSAQQCRLNHLRPAIGFLAYRGDADADLLLEYFIPLNRFEEFVNACKKHYVDNKGNSDVYLSSASIRLLGQSDDISNLSYSRIVNDQPMVSVAIDINVKLQAHTRTPTTAAERWVNQLTTMSIDKDGTFYLPYYNFADKPLFKRAYNTTAAAHAGYTAQILAIQKYNPNRIFWNDFLDKYFTE